MSQKVGIIAMTLTLGFLLSSINAGTAADKEEIMVSAASDLSLAFREIGEMFEKETGYKVIFNFGSSGILAQQIEGGAPVDLFASANRRYIDNLEKKGLVIPETKRTYATGRIVIAVPKGSVKLETLQDLLRKGVDKISIANPSHAPYGIAAREAMEKAGVWDRVSDRMVYGENIRQTFQYVETGDVDAAIVALALCVGRGLEYSLIPQELHTPIVQTMAVIKRARNENKAKQLADYISGPKGKMVLEKYGFGFK